MIYISLFYILSHLKSYTYTINIKMNQITAVIIDNAVIRKIGNYGIIVTSISMAIKNGQDLTGIPKFTQGTRSQDNKLISRLIDGTTMQFHDIFTTCIVSAPAPAQAP